MLNWKLFNFKAEHFLLSTEERSYILTIIFNEIIDMKPLIWPK